MLEKKKVVGKVFRKWYLANHFWSLMWDVIFAGVSNAFLTRFQTSPLDLDAHYFYEVRKNIIETILLNIQEGMGEEILITSWKSHLGTACRDISRNMYMLTEL